MIHGDRGQQLKNLLSHGLGIKKKIENRHKFLSGFVLSRYYKHFTRASSTGLVNGYEFYSE